MTKVACGIVDDNGGLLARSREPTDHTSGEALYQQILALAREVRRDAPRPCVVCGVGSGGPARDHHRLLSPLNIPVWRDFPLAQRLADDLGVPVFVDNDAKALALAEGWQGAAVGVRNYIAMVVSTGVGGGIVVDGRALNGAAGNAGHIGHVVVVPDGRACAWITGPRRPCLPGRPNGTAWSGLSRIARPNCWRASKRMSVN